MSKEETAEEKLTPELILHKLYDNSTDGKAWDKALEDIWIWHNTKECSCPTRTGETTELTCNQCGKIVKDYASPPQPTE